MLLFFACAKKSNQKKAHPASPLSSLSLNLLDGKIYNSLAL
ncbi:hypothetical protein [Mannheimia haemolytica]|nr:hypothetical protein [Mannheimia haemolytica]AGK02276.1 hypothetical protein MHH_c18280 [Mannheimia haemolytica M42548]EEY12966.1 hypothetical protein COK_1081 [Mannheimia haemolytica serotype A2 str. BOVINE]EEY10928.1 hypothetical protein COI_0379 [Mannheimia haemolytica serotype A2 str. OVINE]MDW0538120.1 hypothetical protein [Mannheimia haemolytica]MDW0608650.1 hypothetical protein [Mannheimia haemolytica]